MNPSAITHNTPNETLEDREDSEADAARREAASLEQQIDQWEEENRVDLDARRYSF